MVTLVSSAHMHSSMHDSVLRKMPKGKKKETVTNKHIQHNITGTLHKTMLSWVGFKQEIGQYFHSIA